MRMTECCDSPTNTRNICHAQAEKPTASPYQLCFCAGQVRAEIGIISPKEALKLIEGGSAAGKPIVIDTRGGYKDYFRSHLPTAHHLNFDTLRGTDHGVPVQYLPDDLTRALLIRAGVDRNRTHIIYATRRHSSK